MLRREQKEWTEGDVPRGEEKRRQDEQCLLMEYVRPPDTGMGGYDRSCLFRNEVVED